jgi:gas vesicle protein
MSRFLNGILVGVGIGLLIAPMKGDEMRRLVRERYEELRNNLPEQEQLQQTAQKAASKAQQTRSKVSDLAQQSARKVKQTGQDVSSTTTKTAAPMKQGKPIAPTAPDEGAGRLTSEY